MGKILVVDDEQPIVELVKFNLEKEGHQVLTAYDGNAALALAEADHPDVIILDVMLPERDGFEVCPAVACAKGHRGYPGDHADSQERGIR